MKYLFPIAIFLLCAAGAQIAPIAAWGAAPESLQTKIESEWGGHFKAVGTVTWPDDDSFYQPAGTDAFLDGSFDFRLKNKTYLADWGLFETHYETIVSGGDSRRKLRDLERLYPDLFQNGLISYTPINDDTRLLDLTKTVSENHSHVLYHRLDRFYLSMQPEWGTVSIGRQALTWGNGLIFNPMDLFNPFAPTDIERDYKVGDDMATVRFAADNIGDFQFLYVPRRNPDNNNLEFDRSSLAGKLHFAAGTTEFDIMTARHFKDVVVGLGSCGYLKDAAWRLDATYTFLDDRNRRNGYPALVANLDYSWVWWEKNVYGLLEFYFNGLGSDSYAEAIADPDISERWLRGEMFTLGRRYLSGEIQLELHPLFNLYLTLINNLADPAGIVQPRAVWDLISNVQLTFGANIYYGVTGTEFGGFTIPQTDFQYKPSDNAFAWLTFFF